MWSLSRCAPPSVESHAPVPAALPAALMAFTPVPAAVPAARIAVCTLGAASAGCIAKRGRGYCAASPPPRARPMPQSREHRGHGSLHHGPRRRDSSFDEGRIRHSQRGLQVWGYIAAASQCGVLISTPFLTLCSLLLFCLFASQAPPTPRAYRLRKRLAGRLRAAERRESSRGETACANTPHGSVSPLD